MIVPFHDSLTGFVGVVLSESLVLQYRGFFYFSLCGLSYGVLRRGW